MMILYQNGENEIINNSGVPNKNTSPLKQNEYGQNMFSFNPIHLIFGNITIAYEYFNLKGRSSFKFPLTIGYSNSNFNIGSEIKIFPNKQGKVRYFLGPIVKGGVLDYIKNNRIYNYKYFSFLFSNGGSFQPTKNFNITIDCGIGPGYLISNSNYSRGISFVNYQIGLSLGVRF
jgi:hypothetical protein